MKILLALLFASLLIGCTSPLSYQEGTMTSAGVYVPTDTSLVGVQVLQYLNGCSVKTSSNCNFRVRREYNATNSYFGVINITERTKTEVEVDNEH